MARVTRFLIALVALVLIVEANLETNAEAKKPAKPAADPTEEAAATGDPAASATDEAGTEAKPSQEKPASDDSGAAAADADPAAGVPAVGTQVELGPRALENAFGIEVRGRVVSVPGWMLGLFTKHNVPLLTLGHAGLVGFFRRKNFEIAVAVSYQNMSSADGNWLGAGHQASVDTDYVRFKDFSLLTLDVSFIWHQWFTSWLGMHYGAGIGAAYVRGKILHNDSQNCTESNVGDLSQCHPANVTCANGTCTPESALAPDNAYSVPPAIPIVNVVLGLDFRVPSLRGWEAKIEGGFYDAFFFGGAVGYTF